MHEIRENSGVKMSAEDVSALFGNIELIYSFNRYSMFEELFYMYINAYRPNCSDKSDSFF